MRTTLTLTLVALLLAVGVSTAQADELRTLHPLHAVHAENDLDCESCHANAATSTAGTDLLLPSKDVCADCHDVDDDDACGSCHVSVDDPAGYLPRGGVERFPHATHVAAGMSCASCHGEGPEPMPASKPGCRSCHATAPAYGDCQLCHGAGEDLVPETHAPQWISFHSVDAGWDSSDCQLCHTQSDCQDCHAGDNVRPRSHRLNFRFDHALEAQANELLCASCHSQAEFCSSCHLAEQVMPRNHSRADWAMPTGTGGAHAEEAQFNMESCIACHDTGAAAPMCADCHGR